MEEGDKALKLKFMDLYLSIRFWNYYLMAFEKWKDIKFDKYFLK